MRKSSKALLAAGAAVVVLTGGAGSLAYWNATADVDAGSIDSGRLALEPVAGAAWTLNGTTVPDPTAVRIVPGDVLAYNGSYTVVAEGDNLAADVTVTGGGEGGDLAPFVDTTTAFTLDGSTIDGTVDASDDGKVLAVDITVDFPFGSTVQNASQRKRLDLSDVAVTLVQTDATP